MYLELVGIVGSTSEGGCEYDLQQPMQDSESRPSPYLVACYHCLSRAGRRSEATWTVNRSPASSILTNHPYETRLSFLGPGTKCFHNLSRLSMYLYTCVHSCTCMSLANQQYPIPPSLRTLMPSLCRLKTLLHVRILVMGF